MSRSTRKAPQKPCKCCHSAGKWGPSEAVFLFSAVRPSFENPNRVKQTGWVASLPAVLFFFTHAAAACAHTARAEAHFDGGHHASDMAARKRSTAALTPTGSSAASRTRRPPSAPLQGLAGTQVSPEEAKHSACTAGAARSTP
jgi:hypothetical protein